MKKRKHSLLRMKSLFLAAAMVLVISGTVDGTLAWLTVKTDSIENTFTIGDINIALAAEGLNLAGKTLVPGQEIVDVNPCVTVKGGSVACYLFLHIAEENNRITIDSQKEQILQWELENPQSRGKTARWEAVDGHPGYWCLKVGERTKDDLSYDLLKGKKLTVNPDLEKTHINVIRETEKYPSFSITAAAVQAENIPDVNKDGKTDAQDAWTLLPGTFTGVQEGGI